MSNVSPEAIMKKIEATLEEKSRRAEATARGEHLHVLNMGSKGKGKDKDKKALAKEQEERSKWCDPEDIPVVIIDGYMSRDKGPHSKELWTFIAEWAAVLVENHVAHVIFISNNVTASKPLSKGSEKPRCLFEMSSYHGC
jgi:hypothetical protein